MNTKTISVLTTVAFLATSIPAYAGGWEHRGPGPRHGGYHHDYHDGYVAHRLPEGYVSLLVGGLSLLYCAGLFYRYSPAGYVITQPPVGAVVPVLPPGYTTVIVNGAPYYVAGYTYYAAVPNGYAVVTAPTYTVPVAPPVVVQTPVAVPQPVQTVSAPAPAATVDETQNDFEIHIPNGDGSFTLINLKETKRGFIGPQGEFYADHPTVDELKKRYVKKKG